MTLNEWVKEENHFLVILSCFTAILCGICCLLYKLALGFVYVLFLFACHIPSMCKRKHETYYNQGKVAAVLFYSKGGKAIHLRSNEINILSNYIADRFESIPKDKSFYVSVWKFCYDVIYFEIQKI